ncbi:glycosyltransferase family 2 protein [Chryseobacterium sp.]|uniref:glycosyltransferase family 2 protein n=1 Tax=Chryseobacterium sp. TaxID=1871047 RepID=UPI0011CA04DE|nr:glycosyltransferase [Chryseobacterium sp.]TXF77217.1 glycosyltransferase [Chryseobacterium sp.]
MISIVTAYYNRKKLFIKTLESIQKQILAHDITAEVIAVDDGSNEDERLEDLCSDFPFLKVVRLEKKNKWYKNSCIPFNIGFLQATGDTIIIQNPECLHFGNILKYVEDHIKENLYLSFACYSLDREPTDRIDHYLENPEKIKQIIAENNGPNIKDGTNSWYNHSVIRPVAYHFCTAISRVDLYDLGGFDEKYAHGVGYDDNEFLFRIKLKKMQIRFVDDELVLHLNHYNQLSSFNNEILLSEKEKEKRIKLVLKNQHIFENDTLKRTDWRTNGLKSHRKRGLYSFLNRLLKF